jgi:DNA-binding beta-propeller fold protein YncE
MQKYNFVTKWGSEGTGDGQFFGLSREVAVDASGNVYVGDAGLYVPGFGVHRIQKFDPNGVLITKWGSEGTGDGEFQELSAMAVDASGNIYVADTGNDVPGVLTNRIQKFDSNGTFITKWMVPRDRPDLPCILAVDPSGYVYVALVYGFCIQKFDSNGTLLTKWGAPDWGLNNGLPMSVAIDASGYVYVSDIFFPGPYDVRRPWVHIQKFDSNGNSIKKWGSYGTGDGQFLSPPVMAADALGNVYAADVFNNRIQKFDSNGTLITKWGAEGTGNGQFFGFLRLCVDAAGTYVYVSDGENYRVQKFSLHTDVRDDRWFQAIDPMALLLNTKQYLRWVNMHHPHVPKVAEIEQFLRLMSSEEREQVLKNARMLRAYADAAEQAAAKIK